LLPGDRFSLAVDALPEVPETQVEKDAVFRECFRLKIGQDYEPFQGLGNIKMTEGTSPEIRISRKFLAVLIGEAVSDSFGTKHIWVVDINSLQNKGSEEVQ